MKKIHVAYYILVLLFACLIASPSYVFGQDDFDWARSLETETRGIQNPDGTINLQLVHIHSLFPTDPPLGPFEVIPAHVDEYRIGIGTQDPEAELDVRGTIKTQILEITGGADLAEPFTVLDRE